MEFRTENHEKSLISEYAYGVQGAFPGYQSNLEDFGAYSSDGEKRNED